MVVDGRPYFPVFTWAACPQDVDRDLAIGITVFMEHGAGCGSEADFLAALGQRAYYVPPVGGGLEGEPRLLGYTQPDEPDSHGIGPAQLEDVPGRISFLTLTTGFLRALPRYADPAARDLYGAYRAKADMFGVAVYPLSHLCGVTALASIYEIQRDLVAFAPGKPAAHAAWAGSPTAGRTAARRASRSPTTWPPRSPRRTPESSPSRRCSSRRRCACPPRRARSRSSSARGRTPAASM
jgi:hypothetical protein